MRLAHSAALTCSLTDFCFLMRVTLMGRSFCARPMPHSLTPTARSRAYPFRRVAPLCRATSACGRSQMRRVARDCVTGERPAFETMHPISVRQSVQPSLSDASYFRGAREPITGRARRQLRRYFCIQGRALEICALRWPMGRISDRIRMACALCLQQGKTRRVERRCFGRRVGALRRRCERQHALALRDDLSRFALQGAIHGGLRLDDLLAGDGEIGLRPGLLGVSVCPFGHWEVFSDASRVPDRVRALWRLRIDGYGGFPDCSRQRGKLVFFFALGTEKREIVGN